MFFNKKYIKVNHNEEPEKTQAEEPKQEEAKEAAPVVETVTCKICKKELDKQRVIKNKYVCYECGYYFRVRTKNRIRMVADAGTFETWDNDLKTGNPLNFPEYEEKVAATQEKTGLNEGVTMGSCTINGEKTVLGVIDARFMMGSMGHVVGERITRAMEKATEQKLPVILFCCSGGARMQEGIISLMQMAKTSAAVKRHSDAGLLYIPVLTDPTTGGVTASFAMLGDIILAEPGALIGFAGPRVIEQTIGEKLPDGFQRAEFQLKHGFVDAIVERDDGGIGEVNATTDMYGTCLGNFKITYYCACEKCCNKADGITATGSRVAEGRTIAVDPSVIPYGTKVIIGGHIFTAEDCGGAIKQNHIDIYVNSHEEAEALGVANASVYLVK